MERAFNVKNITCGSCEELIGRAVAKFPNASLKSVDYTGNQVIVDCEDKDFESLRQAVYEKGFSPFGDSKKHSAKMVLKHLFNDKSNALSVERKILEYSVASVFLVLLIQGIFYFLLFQSVPNYLTTFAPLVFLLSVTVVATIGAFAHLSYLKTDLTCMTGMMAGMTIGMTSGFMIGALVGATNGMFVGSLAGMVAGMVLGGYAGKCCGVMGVMEGLMAGLMSGTMGAMLSVMLLNDNVMLFLFILFAACMVILAGLSFAVYKEAGEVPQEKFDIPFGAFATIASVASVIFVLLMIYGPKSAIVLGG